MGTRTPNRASLPATLAFTAVLAFQGAPYASTVQQQSDLHEARQSSSSFYDRGGRDRTSLKTRTDDSYGPLARQGEREKPGGTADGNSKVAAATSAAKGLDDFWIWYADVELFNDDDGDGYYHGIDVLFDADTYFEAADVYAVLYLSFEGGPWNEYAVTETFSIYGATSDDEYVVVTELMTGYPRGNYDLLIEIYDAWDGALVADMGPSDNPELGYLPLEDFERDAPRSGPHRHKHGGGVLDWLTGAYLGFALLAGRRRLLKSPARA